ncbi:minor capsid protein [Tractidigestivibacter sp.]|uniref:minor capsid protein n=1 Tax=Tractidigestivibacter sp. TaxID=2847320 RepID=UPI002A90DDE8|nr:minor capsid protein [Tractidigestivibacter sp.]MDY5271680.1 minor capsid protein [Tractidigestivibacter sp.]
MRYMRPIPRRLLPDDMMVWPAAGDGSFGEAVLVRHVRFERRESAVADVHRSADGGAGLVIVDAANSEGAFEIPAGSRVLMGAGPSVFVRSCRRCCVIRGVVHHWELEVG